MGLVSVPVPPMSDRGSSVCSGLPGQPSVLSRPELLDGSDQVGAVRLAHPLKHPVGSVLSELPVESARKRLLLGFAALKGGIGHVFSGTGAAQVGFGRGCGALHPLIPELLHIAGQRRWAGCLGLRRGGLGTLRDGFGTFGGDGFGIAGGKGASARADTQVSRARATMAKVRMLASSLGRSPQSSLFQRRIPQRTRAARLITGSRCWAA